MSFLDQCNDNIKEESKRFVEKIKTGKIRRRKIYDIESFQAVEKGYLENSLESFKSLTKSKRAEKIMDDYYK